MGFLAPGDGDQARGGEPHSSRLPYSVCHWHQVNSHTRRRKHYQEVQVLREHPPPHHPVPSRGSVKKTDVYDELDESLQHTEFRNFCSYYENRVVLFYNLNRNV